MLLCYMLLLREYILFIIYYNILPFCFLTFISFCFDIIIKCHRVNVIELKRISN